MNQQPPNNNRLDRIEHALERLVSLQASHESRFDRIELSVQASHTRLDRVETAMDRFQAGLDHLLAAQAGHETRLDRLETGIEGLVGLIGTLAQEIDRRFRETDERFRDTDERLGALIRIMDEWIRRQPPPAA